MRLILNGKKAGLEPVRSAVSALRRECPVVDVRVTWEQGDADRFVVEAGREGVRRLVAAGGDGAVNEVVNSLMKLDHADRPDLAIMPLGTANDFASACGIPVMPLEALRLAAHGEAAAIDVVHANQRYFINVASGGFGAQVSAETPTALKNFLGGGTYVLAAVIKALNFTHSQGRLLTPDIDLEGTAIMAAVCNGRQAGGGQVFAPDACLDDGLLDVMVILAFPVGALGQVIQEVINPLTDGRYVKRFRTIWMESWHDKTRSVNLDGEPYKASHIRFDVVPGALQLVLPQGCPCLMANAAG